MSRQLNKRNPRTSIAVVLAALCALLVTSIGSASAIAARPALLDIFGNPICADGSLDGGSSPSHGRGEMPGCCILACSGQHVQAGLAPQSQELPAPSLHDFGEIIAAGYASPARSDRSPANPRAPPAA